MVTRNKRVHLKQYLLLLVDGTYEYNDWYVPALKPDNCDYGKWKWSSRRESEIEDVLEI